MMNFVVLVAFPAIFPGMSLWNVSACNFDRYPDTGCLDREGAECRNITGAGERCICKPEYNVIIPVPEGPICLKTAKHHAKCYFRLQCRRNDNNSFCWNHHDHDLLESDRSEISRFVKAFTQDSSQIPYGHCKCMPDHFLYRPANNSGLDEEAKCVKLKNWMEECDSNEECSFSDKNMACREANNLKRCLCKINYAYNETRVRCVFETKSAIKIKRCPEGQVWKGGSCQKKMSLIGSNVITILWLIFTILVFVVVTVVIVAKVRRRRTRGHLAVDQDPERPRMGLFSLTMRLNRLRYVTRASTHRTPPPAFHEACPQTEPPPTYQEALLMKKADVVEPKDT